MADPRIGCLAMAGLFEAVDQITQAIAQQITDAPSGQRCTKISWNAAAWTGVRPCGGESILRCASLAIP